MFYSASTKGFYSAEIHGSNIPGDAVKITNEEHAALLEGQSEGKLISPDKNGFPVLITPEVVPYIPQSITMRQARLQLAGLGVYQNVNNAVALMGDAAQIEWEYAIDVERTNDITQAMIALLGWTEAETDAYFTAASLL